jgi:hypothetical protein
LLQFPLWHWGALEQPDPLATWLTQAAALQYLPLPHGVVVGVVQAPAPLHVDALTSEVVPLQMAPVQTVVAVGYVQAVADAPLQAPAQVACVPVHAGREPRGVPVTVTHVPALPPSLQAWHWPPQALLQQTPSAQTPLEHSVPDAHVVPFVLAGWQAPVRSQYFPAPQVAEPGVHAPAHFVASAHMFEEQSVGVGLVHTLPLHVDAAVTLPLAQLLAAQGLPHIPQFALSVARFLQTPLHDVCPAGQQMLLLQLPLWHCLAAVHAAPVVSCGTQEAPLQ